MVYLFPDLLPTESYLNDQWIAFQLFLSNSGVYLERSSGVEAGDVCRRGRMSRKSQELREKCRFWVDYFPRLYSPSSAWQQV